MRTMIERLEEYVNKKRLVVNTEKTKIMKFGKKRGRMRKMEWR